MSSSALLPQYFSRKIPTVAYGHGSFLVDTEGKEFLDGCSGAMTANLGHGLEVIADTMREQAARVAFAYRTQFTNGPAETLAARITALAPGDLNTAFFLNSGSEATEFAMRVALAVWKERGQPDKEKILSRKLSYHGMTLGALSMSGHDARRPDYGSLLHQFPVGPPAFQYRYGQPGETEEEYAERSAREFEEALIREDPNTVAAIIVEPIVGAAGGAIVPPAGYLRRLREICDRRGVLLIFDEVITGIGRTGTWFACESEYVVPDLLAIGKGLSAGYYPVSGVLICEPLVETLRVGRGVAPFGHTYSGNPLGAATSLAVLDYIDENDLLANVQERGRQLEVGLLSISNRNPHFADVRGRGLMWGGEIVRNPLTKAAPEPALHPARELVDACAERGLLVYPAGIAPLANAVLFAPPLNVSEGEIALLLQRFESALVEVVGRWGW